MTTLVILAVAGAIYTLAIGLVVALFQVTDRLDGKGGGERDGGDD